MSNKIPYFLYLLAFILKIKGFDKRKLLFTRINKTINQRIRKFIAENRNNPLPEREQKLKPEIIIPCFNHGVFIEAAIKSVHETNLPITIINNASTDNSLEIIQKLKKKYNFKLINNKINLNQWGSINKGVVESENNLFFILCADDLMVPYAINTSLTIYQNYNNVYMIGGGAIIFTKQDFSRFLNIFPDKLPYVPNIRIYNSENAVKYSDPNDICMTFSGSSFFRSAWEAVGGYKELNQRVCSYDDRDFQMRVSSLFNVAVIDEPFAFYRVGSSTWNSNGKG